MKLRNVKYPASRVMDNGGDSAPLIPHYLQGRTDLNTKDTSATTAYA